MFYYSVMMSLVVTIELNNVSSKSIVSVHSITSNRKKIQLINFVKSSPMKTSTSFSDKLYQDENNDIHIPASTKYSLSQSRTKPNEQDRINTMIDDEFETSSTVDDDNKNCVYLEKINELATKVQQQSKMIKQQDAEIQRLRSTTIGNS